MPGASGGQDVQDALEQAAGITRGSADVRLCWRKVVPENLPDTIVDFPEGHDLGFYLKGPIFLGRPPLIEFGPGKCGIGDLYYTKNAPFFRKEIAF